MKRDMRAILAILILAGSVPASDTLVLSGSVTATLHPYHTHSANKLHFLGKFCFSNVEPHTGQIIIETKVRAGAKGTHVLLFDDTKWPQIWASRESISCHEAVGRANSAAMQDELDWIDGLPIGVSRHSMQVNDIIRPHYWYAAAVNCNGPLDMSYTMTFLQPDAAQLSFDLQGCEKAYSMLSVITILLLVTNGHAHRWRLPAGYGVTTLSFLSLALLIAACLFKMTHLNLMATDGRGAPLFDAAGDLLHAAAFVAMAGVWLLAAHGWATVHPQVSTDALLRVCLCLAALTATHLLFLINAWFFLFFLDNGSVTYAWESYPGYIALAAQLASMYYFGRTLTCTLSDEAAAPAPRKQFLMRLLLAGLVWFAVVPVTVLIAALLDPYVRAKSVAIMRLIVDTACLACLVYLTAPARQDQFFRQASVPTIYSALDGSSAYDNL